MQLPKWFSLKPQEDPVFAQEYPETPEEAIVAEVASEPCSHLYQARTVSYAPPRPDVNASDPVNSDLLSTLLLGVTTLVDECQLCHEIRKTSMLGSPDPQLDDLLTKATEYGPQYIQKSGITYCIQRYIPPPQPVGLPLR